MEQLVVKSLLEEKPERGLPWETHLLKQLLKALEITVVNTWLVVVSLYLESECYFLTFINHQSNLRKSMLQQHKCFTFAEWVEMLLLEWLEVWHTFSMRMILSSPRFVLMVWISPSLSALFYAGSFFISTKKYLFFLKLLAIEIASTLL